MKKCNHCDGCGCPKCLSFGVNLSSIVKKIKNPFTQKTFKVSDYDNFTVADQRMVKNLIEKMITANVG